VVHGMCNIKIYLTYFYVFYLFNKTKTNIMQQQLMLMNKNNFNYAHGRRFFASFYNGYSVGKCSLILFSLQKLTSELLLLR
jgi:hypothetical protein